MQSYEHQLNFYLVHFSCMNSMKHFAENESFRHGVLNNLRNGL